MSSFFNGLEQTGYSFYEQQTILVIVFKNRFE